MDELEKKTIWFPIACVAMLFGMVLGLAFGGMLGERKGRIEGRCSTYQAFAVAAGYGSEQRILPIECQKAVRR